MIAKIGRGTNIYGALLYNHSKVLTDNGAILHLHNMRETPHGNYTVMQLLSAFAPYLVANKNTEKTALHISLNPDPADGISDEDYIKIAEEYMQKLGYGEQPYVIFKHTDIERTHIHIVSTTVDRKGIKIPDSFEKKKSMDICRELETKFNLSPATEKQFLDSSIPLNPVNYSKGNIKAQIASVVRYLPKYYQFQTLGSYNALLSLFNITSEHIKKEYSGEIKEGLVYFAMDENGNKVSNPFKSSLFGKQAGLNELRTHFDKSRTNSVAAKSSLTEVILQAMQLNPDEKNFKDYLIQHGINTVIRRNEQNRIYGITFIDHNTKTVFNGSQLGKQFSANIFQELFLSNGLKLNESKMIQSIPPIPTNSSKNNNSDNLHPFFDFMMHFSNLDGFGLLDSLLMGGFAEDPEEQAFEYNMKKRRRRHK
ncbi:relaxase [Chryseobacterium pennae]|uniref:Relaxase n=1 Tax=Chryseobacterium pennae TaxID=2258962 RepID=A0A3D9C9E8_9FLAO|nr:conjugal transfer protein MobB [Chryseobacterium pennae]REC62328.1 relaxase [Chryseobacterium pennae]